MAAKTHTRALGLLCALLLHRCAVAYQIPTVYQVIIPQQLESPLSRICYSVTLGERTYSMLLMENWAPGYIGYSVHTQNRARQLSSEKQSFPGHCYLQGTLDGVQDSYVALSACSGFRGFLQTEFYTYAIEPVKDSSTFQHLVYRLEDVHTVPMVCFNIRPERTILDELYKKQQEKKGRHDAGRARKERQIQLYVIVDHDLFLHHAENLTEVIDVVYSVLNMADAMFAPVYLKLLLVGLEVWNTKNVIPSSRNVHTFLTNLGTWKVRNLAGLKADMVVLLRKDGIDSVFGATYTGGICWNRNGVMFVTVTENILPATAAQLAHELGHSLGIPLDTDYASDCPCILSSCIMLHSGAITTSFSECSLKFYSDLVDQGGAYCLKPASLDLFITRFDNPYCGNRIVEGSEECDCGTSKECSRDPCCNDICKFKGSAQCSIGKCCRNCRFAKKGTVCRKLSSVCDLSEYCNGTSDLCPADVYIQDGSPCNHNNSYCVGNRCYDYGNHCKGLFGKGAKVASRECFMAINTIGDETGNCGFKDQNISPIKCEIDSVMCGRVQCNAVQIKQSYNAHLVTIQTSFGDESCLSIAHDYSTIDIGAVEDGAQCDVGKICLARKCVNISLLRFSCDVHINCNGNGVCNSNNNCHCNYGWAPPDCGRRGYGGSIESGPLLFKSSVQSIHDFKIADPPSESSEGTQRVRQTFTNNLAIGLGITLPLVAVGAVLAVIFRQRIAALVK